MPESWHDRMATIETYEEDESAQGRLSAWTYMYEQALNSPVGAGFEAYAGHSKDAHSIYFETLGEHGFIGLGLFLMLGIFTWRSGGWVIRNVKNYEDMGWAGDLASMIQVSMMGYAVSGAFLGLAYFDLYYHLVALIVLLKMQVKGKAASLTDAVIKRT